MKKNDDRSQLKHLVVSGLLPIFVYTVVEQVWGVYWGVIFSILFGIAEVVFEKFQAGRISKLTLFSNGLVILLGVVSLATQEGHWFKLQPAILEGVFGIILLGSFVIKKPLLSQMVSLQPQFLRMPPEFQKKMAQATAEMTLRMAAFFALHAGLATYAAFYFSTSAWALLKGIGFTGSFILYLVVEAIWMRRQATR